MEKVKKFSEWLQEAYGYEDEAGESLDAELYGIRQSVGNALASGHLEHNWGDLGMRIRGLQKLGVSIELLKRAVKLYEGITNAITKGYEKAGTSGATVASAQDERAMLFVQEALKNASDIFQLLKDVLSQMSSQSSRHLGHV
jgi:hypothetical protein